MTARAPRSEVLDPLRFPLRGSRLVEASAGTGKTWTIAALYIRMVLGHGGAAAPARALVPPEILVVTFTEAATKELRDRIRARLAEAAEAFLADPAALVPRAPGADLLHDLRAEFPVERWPAAARVLRLAAEWMDEAAISTIHGWCQRMLSEHAFDSGSLFTQTLEPDQRELQAEAVRDYWRCHFTALPPDDAATVRDWWPTPEALHEELRPLLALDADALGAGRPPAEALGEARDARDQALAALRAPWPAWADELKALLDAACARKQVNGRRLQARHYDAWLDGLRAWAAGLSDTPMPKASTGWTRLTRAGLAEVWTSGPAPDHPALTAVEALRARLAALPTARDDLVRHAAAWVARRHAAEQARRAQMGFDDLLLRLDAALHGPNGDRLAARIRRQFPAALIDEFQDTDTRQYRIFDAIYRVAEDAPDTVLILIGDPKQAIYAFRGADIHTYLAARRDTAGRHVTLGTNFRSALPMVRAVNALFMGAEAAAGRGAFRFRTPADDPLPFQPVAARGRVERWSVDGRPAPALTAWWPAGEMPGAATNPMLAEGCAIEIVRLLRAGQQGQAGFAGPDGRTAPLQPGDVAVLVNSRHEAAAVRQALRARGVRTVYLSDSESVFQSPVAADLQRWLAACAEPDDDRTLRNALGTPTLALSWPALDRLNHDELHWEERVLQFRGYRQRWRRQGVLPMLRQLMHDFGVPQRLLADDDERALTDLLHLAELLQQAAALIDGEHALIRHLAEQREDRGVENEARKLRLESDADLVKVVTVHKSKGLEYPLVFLPFASSFRAVGAGDRPLRWHDEAGRLRVAPGADDAVLAQADDERLGEDLRKFYVALTRARHATWIGAVAAKEIERGALGWLLGGGAPLPAPALQAALDALAAADPEAIAVVPLPQGDTTRFEAQSAPRLPAPEPPLPAGPREPWWIASYSALRTGPAAALGGDADTAGGAAEAAGAAPASAAEDTYAEARADEPDAPDAGGARWSAPASMHAAGGTDTEVCADEPGAPAGGGDAGAARPSASALLARPGTGAGAMPVVPDDPAIEGEATGLHLFPRGAAAGSFLHGLLEWAGRRGFARVAEEPGARADLADLIARRCNLAGWSHWVEPLRAWLAGWLTAPLPLAALTPGVSAVAPAALATVQVEMEFWFGVQGVDTRALDALVRRHTLGGAARAPLAPQQLNGMLKGYIDLVFEHEGRCYVADYKSNRLGPRAASYGPDALRAAVLAHRYELQYVLYVFALHRLLRARRADYDYDRHVGGAVYLFLRGQAAPGRGLHVERPPRVLIEALDRLFDGGTG